MKFGDLPLGEVVLGLKFHRPLSEDVGTITRVDGYEMVIEWPMGSETLDMLDDSSLELELVDPQPQET